MSLRKQLSPFSSPLMALTMIVTLLLAGCGQPTATPTPPQPTPTAEPAPPDQPAPPDEASPLYLSILWHQHQPVYFKDPETGVYEKPWVRLHAAKDYVDMVAILEQHPDVQATFNLTPSLLRQLLDLEGGAKDLYQVHTEVAAAALTDEQKAFIGSHFFDINPKIIARFPRYLEIADDRDNSAGWDAQTWLDLQVLFNLGWTDPDWLAAAPLAELVAKGRNFSEEDKAALLAEHARLVAQVIPLHRRLQDEGRIEVTTTPFFHPILPLLLNSNLASVAAPDVELPAQYAYGFDAVEQIEQGVAFYEEIFGRPPLGMWPAEGAVAQEIVGMVAGSGIRWMATDEEVLARSLGQTAFARNAQDVVQEADTLYRPYVVSSRDRQMYILFRDKVISDKVGFTYSGSDGLEAAQDFVRRLLDIRERLQASGASGPHLVSVILDGENAWEHYPNDGKKFLNNLYRLLEEEQQKGALRTILPSAYVAQFPDQPAIESLWAGSWVSPDYLTWIGEDEENRAWNYLGRVRAFVERKKDGLDEGLLAAVMDAIYTAEGSDWFWWYGADQNSGDDGGFDLQFRRTLQRVYELLEEPIPIFLKVPVIPQAAQAPAASPAALLTPEIDGRAGEGEWEGAGYYLEEGGVQANPLQIASQLWYGLNKESLFLRLDARRPWANVGQETRIGFYLTRPGGGGEQPFSRLSVANDTQETLLGFGAQALVEIAVTEGQASAAFYVVDETGAYREAVARPPVGLDGDILELALPFADFGKPDAGDRFRLRVVISEGQQRDIQVVPAGGPGQLLVPDLGLTTPVLTIVDPTDDDHGPGGYVYPSDAVFGPQAYDLTEFAVAEDDNNLSFRFTFAGDLNNDWGAPNGMGIHTLDVYIDAAEGGARQLLPGRNAALPAGSGWEFAIWAEGWTPGLYAPAGGDSPSPAPLGDSGALSIVSDPGQSKISIRVRKQVLTEALGLDAAELAPATWNYLAVVMSQEGFPASGVWRVRDVEEQASQWRLGGAPPNSTIHSRIIDVAYAADFPTSQEAALGDFEPRNVDAGAFDALTPDDFAQLPMTPAGQP